jgi:hypothetical protein
VTGLSVAAEASSAMPAGNGERLAAASLAGGGTSPANGVEPLLPEYVLPRLAAVGEVLFR